MKMPRRVTQINGLEIDEISLVDKGANQHSKVTIAKSADGENKEQQMEIYDEQGNLIDPDSLSDGDVVYDSPDPETRQALQFELDEDPAAAEGAENADDKELAGVAKSDTGNPFRREVQKNDQASSFVDGLRQELSKALNDRDRDAVVSKALDQVAKLEVAANQAVEIAKAERETRLRGEFTEIAKSYNLPIEDDVLGETLLHCAQNLSEDDCRVIAKALETASNASVLDELGKVGGGSNSDVLAKADALISKSGKVDSEARAEFYLEHPDMYEDYLSENR